MLHYLKSVLFADSTRFSPIALGVCRGGGSGGRVQVAWGDGLDDGGWGGWVSVMLHMVGAHEKNVFLFVCPFVLMLVCCFCLCTYLNC
jgi:hypothetical protein